MQTGSNYKNGQGLQFAVVGYKQEITRSIDKTKTSIHNQI